MIKRPHLSLSQLIVPFVLLAWAPSAFAASNDAQAEELREQAIFDDYLNLRFDAAEAKLNQGIQLCESGCSSSVKAKLYRDLGVVYVAGMKQREAGVGMFVEALTADPSIKLDPDLSSEELQDAMDEARELAGSAPPPESSGGEKQPPPESTEPLPETGSSSQPAIAIEDCPPDFPGCAPDPEDDFDEPPDHMNFARHWITVGGQLDFLLMHAVGDACAGSATSELACFEGDTYWDPTAKGGRQDLNGDGIFDDSGSTTSGFALGTKRVLVGYDYAITQNILAGARLGWAFGTRPKLVYADPNTPSSDPLPPLHFEVRGAYWFGSEVLTDQLVRPFVQLSGGFAQVDAYLETEVVDQTNGRMCDAGSPATSTCRVSVEAWRKSGTFFLSGGAGLTFAVSKNVGILLEGRFMQLLPTSGSALAGGGGLMFGF